LAAATTAGASVAVGLTQLGGALEPAPMDEVGEGMGGRLVRPGESDPPAQQWPRTSVRGHCLAFSLSLEVQLGELWRVLSRDFLPSLLLT